MKIYLASSWRNPFYEQVLAQLREAGHEVFDFKHPKPDSNGFHWSEIDPDWKRWSADQFRSGLGHELAEEGFACDMAGLQWREACVLLLPCGRSAHLEAGWAKGSGRPTIALLSDGEPELMYGMFDHLCLSVEEVLDYLRQRSDLREELAALAHDRWSHWTKYLFKCGSPWSEGGFYIPCAYVNRWRHQMETPYKDLSALEQKSDCAEADLIIAVLRRRGLIE